VTIHFNYSHSEVTKETETSCKLCPNPSGAKLKQHTSVQMTMECFPKSILFSFGGKFSRDNSLHWKTTTNLLFLIKGQFCIQIVEDKHIENECKQQSPDTLEDSDS